MSDILDLETRKNIYELIKKNPGIKLKRIAEYLHLSLQLVTYHLSYLQNHGLITFDLQQGFKQCYITGDIGEYDKKILSLLHQQIALQIVLFLLKHPYSRHRDIIAQFPYSSPRVTYHLKKLITNNIIEQSTKENIPLYKIGNDKQVISILIRYKESDIFTSIKETWEDFGFGID